MATHSWLIGRLFLGALPPHTHTLDLGGNAIRFLAPADFAGLGDLRVLDLAGNRIAKLDAGTFMDVRGLEVLDVSGALHEGDPETFLELSFGTRIITGAGAGGGAKAVPDPATCTHRHSRKARDTIDASFFQAFAAAAAEEAAPPILLTCPLLPYLDHYWSHEVHLLRRRASHFRCGYCGKAFESERFLEDHFVRRHMDRVPPHTSVCPQSLCDMLVCTCVAPCDEAVMARARDKCAATVKACFAHEHSARAADIAQRTCNRVTCAAAAEKCAAEKASDGEGEGGGLLAFIAWGLLYTLPICGCIAFLYICCLYDDSPY